MALAERAIRVANQFYQEKAELQKQLHVVGGPTHEEIVEENDEERNVYKHWRRKLKIKRKSWMRMKDFVYVTWSL